MTTSDKLRLELDSAVDDWDFHIDRCQECMARESTCAATEPTSWSGSTSPDPASPSRNRKGSRGTRPAGPRGTSDPTSPAVTQNAHWRADLDYPRGAFGQGPPKYPASGRAGRSVRG